MKKITSAETDNTITLFARSLGVAFNLRKFVNSISGSEILKITFESMPSVSLLRTLNRAAIAPIKTTIARMAI
jgi:hypothetical protein